MGGNHCLPLFHMARSFIWLEANISGMSWHGESLSSVTPDKQRITCKNKRKNTSETSIKGKESIQEPENQCKREK